MKTRTHFTTAFVLLMAASTPLIVFANGGDQRVADGYLVNLSRAPFTPIAGVKTALLASFVDLENGNLIQDDMLVSVRIAEGRGSKTFIHEKKDIPVHGGVLEYSYTFRNPGMHEIFFDFTFAGDPAQEIHELPDFLVDVQKTAPKTALDNKSFSVGAGIGIASGLLIGWLFGKRWNARYITI